MSAYRNSREHLFEELRRLDLVLNLAVARQRRDPTLAGFNEFRGLFISEDEIDHLLAGAGGRPAEHAPPEDEETLRLHEAVERAGRRSAALVAAAAERGVSLALERLARLFRLSGFDVDALLVCLAPELNVRYGKLYAYLQNDVTRKAPTADLILNLFCRTLSEKLDARSRLTADAPLVRHQLIRYAGEEHDDPASLLTRALVVDERVLNYLLDVDAPDARLAPFVRVVKPSADLGELLLPDGMVEGLTRLFRGAHAATAEGGAGALAFILSGPAGAGKEFAAEALCRDAGCGLLVADVHGMSKANVSLARLLARLFREARLRRAAVYLDGAETVLGDGEQEASARRALLAALGEFEGVALLGSREPWHPSEGAPAGRFFHVTLPAPDYAARLQLWQRFLAREGAAAEGEIETEALADKFGFTAGRIRDAVAEARQRALLREGAGFRITTADLYHACRAQSSKKLLALARKITPLYTWNDIILPPDQLEHLREVCAHVKHRQRVFADWGFGGKISLGKGLSALFVGPSGTGKTMAAEVIAGELGLDLFKIDLSCLVSKYIGETEKNLSRVFEEAEQSNAILFFDEADSVFGKRSEVKDSHDRYANIEVNYLLQRMEEYEGVVVLASNYQRNIDEAFTRRIRFIIEFPFPDDDYRRRIWGKVFPEHTPLGEDIDFEFLSHKLKLTGGNIRNIALGAAFLAAGNGGRVQMGHVICAAKREFQKMGRLLVRSDFDEYFDLVGSAEAIR
ncbi:MAG TPA: AAA family ATPase [Pyrinomonadaceae bacterium]|jgi:ATP-dependent 26S proteasome regulatory subunit